MTRAAATKRFVLASVIAALVVLCTKTAFPAAGLLAVYRDAKHTVQRVVPTPNFTLAAKQSVHAQIRPKFNAVFTGVLKVSRGGEYTLVGDAAIEIDGKDAIGRSLRLSAGDHSLKVTYRRQAGAARLQLRWKSDFFIEEPIPPAAFAHEPKDAAVADSWAQVERGRLLYENFSCGGCHAASDWNLSIRGGPDLSDIGARVGSDWISTWLSNPRHYRKTAAMPVLLTNAEEIGDVVAYLSGLVETPSVENGPLVKIAERVGAGKELFDRTGCSKCHRGTQHSLSGVGGKYRSPRALAKFLADPLRVDPSGRMPQMFDPKTQSVEAELVAEFLFHTDKGPAALRSPIKSPAGGDVTRGRQAVQSRGCLACHQVKDGKNPLSNRLASPQFTKPGARFDPRQGCLADIPAKEHPNYQLSAADRSSLRAFLGSVTKQPVVAAAPIEAFYRRLSQYNCVACHALNDRNNGPAQQITDDGKIVNIEQPPSLTGAGDKLRVDWIKRVLFDNKRTRPWMKLRMPHFGGGLEQLPELFVAASGSPLKDPSPEPNRELAAAGLETIGVQRGQTACITCHDYRGINQQTEGVVPAPDMAEIGETLRGEWFRRWLHDPQRIQPGTSMPRFFQELKTGPRDRKIEELWATLYHQADLPLPKGLIETQSEGTQIVVGDDPVVFRVATKITPQLQINRAVNVGLPSGINYTLDAATARLRGVWRGAFINAGPAWGGRGGKPVNVLPESLFVPLDHFPLRIGDAFAEPQVRFLGYYLLEKYPVFRYAVDGVEIHERFEVTETGLVRHYTIDSAPKTVFFVDDKQRAYTSTAGAFRDGVLAIPAGKSVKFEVRRSLPMKKIEIKDLLKWVVAGQEQPPSSKAGSDASVLFENKTNRRVKIVWVGYDGKLQVYGELKPGETRRQNSYSNNTWLITDENDKPLGHFIVRAAISRAIIPQDN